MILILSSFLWLCSPGLDNIASGQVIDTLRVLQGGDNGRCSSLEERERARNDIRQVVIQSDYRFTCSGPGWRRVAFINMTDTSYSCPTGLNLTSYSKRTCGRSHTTGEDALQPHSVLEVHHTAVCVGG